MRIAIDVMGGDFAPDAVIKGVELTLSSLNSGEVIILVGNANLIPEHLKNHAQIEVVHTDSVIEMGEHPAKGFSSKPNSSIGLGFELVKTNKADAFCSAGNTGAMMVGSMLVLKPIPGIIRPAIAGYVPKINGSEGTLLDVGANADCKPEMLAQFGEIGSIYAQAVLQIEKPKVGLLNLGEEEGKGNLVSKDAHQLLKSNPKINFIGNIEGRDIFNDKADVIVCDGFTGNVVTKMAEHFYEILHERGVNDSFLNKMNYEGVGGSPIIGVNGNIIIGHGVSSPPAIKNMILQAIKQVQSGLGSKLQKALFEYTTQIDE